MTGILCVDKPAGLTSFGTISRLRRILGVKKMGHAGTLDPMATGVLPVLIGSSTRFLELLPNHDKGYRALVKLGVRTDTLDTTGELLEEKEAACTQEQVETVLEQFRGRQMQVPPMYSAISKDGKRLYELARQGVEVEREPREIELYKLKLIAFDAETQEFELDVICSKGTYIRSLADDIGQALGCGAALAGLRRTMAAGFKLDQCYTLEELEEYMQIGQVEKRLTAIEDAMGFYPPVPVTEKQAVRFSNGGALDLTRMKGKYRDAAYYRLFAPSGAFLGVGLADQTSGQMLAKRIYTA